MVKQKFPLECIAVLMKYLDLFEVVTKLMPCNRQVRELVITENYIIFKHFLRYFTLSKRLIKSDIPAKINIMKLVYDNVNVQRT